MGTSGSDPDVTRDDARSVFSNVDEPGTPLTTAEVADRLDCDERIARRKLDPLAELGFLATREIDDGCRVWWQPTDGHVERNSELEEYGAFVSSVEDYAIFTLDPDGIVATWNEGAERIKGYRGDEIVGRHISTFYTDEEVEAGVPERNLETAAREGHVEDEGWRVRKEGTRFWANVVITAIRNDDGELRGYTKVTRDITERKQREQRLENLVERLEESNSRLEQFAYAASHDLQEPLRMVSSYLRLIERRYSDDLDEDGREFLEFAVDGADRMRNMIEGLLKYSRVDTRGKPFQPVDLNAVLKDARNDLQVRIEETDAEITADELPVVTGDDGQLRQLVQNLVDNAIEYSGGDRPRVHVAADRNGDWWEVSVRDEGIGIDPEDSERIFDVFQSLHAPDDYSGTGIGLALCERIVERHGGDIWVDSEPSEGATFTFTLPAEGEYGG